MSDSDNELDLVKVNNRKYGPCFREHINNLSTFYIEETRRSSTFPYYERDDEL